MNRKSIRAALIVLGLLAANPAWAHDPGLSIATATRAGGTLFIQLGMARSDVEFLVRRDANASGATAGTELQAALPALQALARGAFRVAAEGRALAPASPVVNLDQANGIQFEIPFEGPATGTLTIQALLLDKLPRGHRQFLSLRDQPNHPLGEQLLDAAHPTLTARLPDCPAPSEQPHAFRYFAALGVEHIGTGYDHLLFLLGLLLVGGSLRVALQIITSFTVAHSITLALATLNLINIPPRIIEPMIAASIVFVGIQNILDRGVEKRWLLTFGFGLIHGCGFASALRNLGLGAHGTSLVVPLLSFNLGVELGQLALALLALPCIWKCRTSPAFVNHFVPVGSGLIVLAGGYWLVERILL